MVRLDGLTLAAFLALVGIGTTIAVPVATFTGMKRAEDAMVATMTAIAQAQRAFRSGGGRGGYATSLESLTQSCPHGSPPLLSVASNDRYTVTMRAARDARPVGVDCHGRPTANDYYVAARPAEAFAGRVAFAATSRGRVFMFFDGIPPVEDEMTSRGLAVASDSMPPFKIP